MKVLPNGFAAVHGGWIGVDLDATLAEYHGWVDYHEIGKPVPRMLARVLRWLAEGKEVRIFTARAWHGETQEQYDHAERAIEAIQRWCVQHIGQELKVTCVKDLSMIELWDDRAIQVIPNKGLTFTEATVLLGEDIK